MTLSLARINLLLLLVNYCEVYGSRLFLMPPLQATKAVELGSDAAVTCVGRIDGEHVLQWFRRRSKKAEEPIKHNHKRVFTRWHNISNTEGGPMLFLNDVHSGDAATYTCRNSTSSEAVSFDLIVNEPIRFVGTPTNVTGVVNHTLVIPCEAVGSPKPVVQWKHNLVGERYEIGGDGLVIYSLSKEDAGTYQCMAWQKGTGTFQSIYINVTVHYAPEWANQDSRSVVYKTSASNAKLSCKATGFPPPDYTWYLDDNPISEDVDEFSVSSKGSYHCSARNVVGEIRRYFTVKEGRVPKPPVSVMPHNVTNNSLKVNFTAPPHSEIPASHENITGYRVEVFSQKGNHRIHLNLSGDPTTFTVTDLKPNTLYIVRLRAENEVGLGDVFEVKVTTKSLACNSVVASSIFFILALQVVIHGWV